jgi:regulator of protease activity HflC (stomatin/prohibitin superfamily)
LNVGTVPEKEEQESRVALWTAGHPHDENFLVANRERSARQAAPAGAARKAPPVSLLTVGIPVQFQIHDLEQWAYNHEDSATLLQQLATREVIRYLGSVDLNEIMSRTRQESAAALRDRIQAAADANHLGAKVLFVGLQDLHPPVKVAPEYEKVVAAIHLKQSKILAAQAYAISTNILAGAQAFMLTNNAEAARLDLELTASARAAAFTNQLPAYNAAPSVYLQRAYLQTFATATAKPPKYLLLATNTTDVIQFDLQRRLADDIANQVAGAIAAPKK